MKWYNVLQLSAMLLMAAAMPVTWRVGLWAAVLLCMVSAIKIVVERRIWNPLPDARLRWPLFAVLLYWFYLLLSALWSADKSAAMSLIWLKSTLPVFSLVALLSDTSYLRRRHLQWMRCSLVAGVLGKFVYCIVHGIIKHSENFTLAKLFGNGFDPTHHAYIAMYIAVALLFVYFVLASQWREMPRCRRAMAIATVPIMLLYIIIVNSRAGIVVMYSLIVLCMVHLAVFHRHWRTAILVGLLTIGCCYGTESVLPGHIKRVEKMVAKAIEGEKEDTRITITRSSTKTVVEQPLLGHGAGDYLSDLSDTYEDEEFSFGVKRGLNAHNQYVESLLSTGIPGLLTLIAMLGMPLIVAILQRSRYLWLIVGLTFIVAVNLLFESMLERQMGLLFVGFLYMTMVLILSLEENKFVQMENS